MGILFRDASRGKDFWPNRNLVEKNRILDSGKAKGRDEKGIAIDVQGKARDVTIAHNELRETRQPGQRIGIRLGAETDQIKLANNTIEDFATAVRKMDK